MARITLPPRDTRKWVVSPLGELLGSLWSAKNIDLESAPGKVRLSERAKIIYSDVDDSDFDTQPIELLRSNADGTDRWWAAVRGGDNATGAMWKTSGTSPLAGWAQDNSLSFPAIVRHTLETFLRVGGFDRLVGANGNDLWMANSGNAAVLNISSSTNAAPIVVTTSASHNLQTDDQVTIAGHTINTNANGTWRIIRLSATTFSLNGSTGNGAGGADGTVTTGKYINRWWRGTLGQTALDTAHPTVVRRFNKILLVGNANFVHVITPSADGSVSSSANVAYKRLTFPDHFQVNWIVVTPRLAWIGLNNLIGGDAVAASWNGGDETYSDPIPLFDRFTLSGVIWRGVPYAVNGKGQLLVYTGAAFEQVNAGGQPVALPPFYLGRRWTNSGVITDLPNVLHRNGMKVIDGSIHMLLNNIMEGSYTTMPENFPAGMWVYNPDLGLRCKYSLGMYPLESGNWGTFNCETPGAIAETTVDFGRFLAGASVFRDASLTRKGIFVTDGPATASHRGHFVTTQLPSQKASALWGDLVLKFRRLDNATDVIVAKARTERIAGRDFLHMAAITWVSTTQFTATHSGFANAVVGDEIQIQEGNGSGATAHISAITLLAGTYTVTLDEAIPGVVAATTGAIALSNYQKIGSVADQSVNNRLLQILRDAPWVQLKVELRGTATSPEVEELQVNYENVNI